MDRAAAVAHQDLAAAAVRPAVAVLGDLEIRERFGDSDLSFANAS